MRRRGSGAHAAGMFPFTSYEATKILVEEHLADLRAVTARRRPRPTAHRRPAFRHGDRYRWFW